MKEIFLIRGQPSIWVGVSVYCHARWKTTSSWLRLRGRPGGRIIRKDKRGAIDASLNPILQRLDIDADTWLFMATEFEDATGPWVGTERKLAKVCKRTKKKWICNTPAHQKLHPS